MLNVTSKILQLDTSGQFSLTSRLFQTRAHGQNEAIQICRQPNGEVRSLIRGSGSYDRQSTTARVKEELATHMHDQDVDALLGVNRYSIFERKAKR